MKIQHQQKIAPSLMILTILIFEMTTDLYLPSLPEMATFFGASDFLVKFSLSSYLLGFAVPGCLSGPLSDAFGRRKITLWGMGTFAVGSILCWLPLDIYNLIAWRFLQGLGAGIACVVGTALIKDLFDDVRCSRIFSTMGAVIALSPMVAPILGGYFADVWGWHINFSIIAVCGLLPLMASFFFLPESLPKKQRSKFSVEQFLETYRLVITNRQTVVFGLISGITYGGLWVWIVEAPFYVIEVLGVPAKDFGYYNFVGPGAYILGTIVNQQLVSKFKLRGMLSMGIMTMLMGSSLLVLTALLFEESLLAIYASMVVYCLGLGPVFANAATLSVGVEPHQRGTASALLTTIEMGCAAICASIIGLISNLTLIRPMAMLFVCSILCLLLYRYAIYRAPITSSDF